MIIINVETASYFCENRVIFYFQDSLMNRKFKK